MNIASAEEQDKLATSMEQTSGRLRAADEPVKEVTWEDKIRRGRLHPNLTFYP